MDFCSLDCYNDRVPGTRSFEGWNDRSLCLVDIFVDCDGNKRNPRIHRSFILPGQECEI